MDIEKIIQEVTEQLKKNPSRDTAAGEAEVECAQHPLHAGAFAAGTGHRPA